MKRHRRSISAVFALAVLAIGGTAGTAQAHGGTLLSGYGTTGEGNQAILGSALLGGGSKGGGAGSGGSGGGVPRAGSSQGAGVQAAGSNGASTGISSGAVRGSGQTAAAPQQHGRAAAPQAASRRTAGARTGTSGRSHMLSTASASVTPASAPVLGITGTDLLYILLGVGGLLLTGIFTRQLVNRPH
jgi:hypothetical protein